MEKEREFCPDCGVHKGEYHDWNCDVGRCMLCGGQRLACDCPEVPESLERWSGVWPGVKECIELGLYCRWSPGEGGWVRTTADDPEAQPDLNTLYTITEWDPVLLKRVLR
jgi:hypothetical protein